MKIFIFTLLLATSTLSHATTIQFSAGIENKYKKQMQQDFQTLENFKFKDVDPNTLKVLGIKELNGKTALAWLEERIHYVVEQNFPYQNYVSVLRENVSYPNDVPGEAREHAELDMGEVPPSFYMANTGIWLYNVGKWNRTQYGIVIPTAENKNPAVTPINSPRVGIIMIGNALFGYQINKKVDSIANAISRIGTYFHEARHSDGNGESLGFAHADCGRSYELLVCEANANGSYSVEQAIMLEMIKSCEGCSAAEKNMLNVKAYGVTRPDNTEGVEFPFWDTTPESI